MHRIVVGAFVTSFAWAATVECAQSPRSHFEASFPTIGDRLPDVTIVDAAGAPFPLRSLEGSVAVIVFGCLT